MLVWSLEEGYEWDCLESRNRDTDIEKQCIDTKGGRGSGMNWEDGVDILIYTLK